MRAEPFVSDLWPLPVPRAPRADTLAPASLLLLSRHHRLRLPSLDL